MKHVILDHVINTKSIFFLVPTFYLLPLESQHVSVSLLQSGTGVNEVWALLGQRALFGGSGECGICTYLINLKGFPGVGPKLRRILPSYPPRHHRPNII